VEAATAAADAERVRLVPALAEAARALRLQKKKNTTAGQRSATSEPPAAETARVCGRRRTIA
jgi:hypothetical protein